jgi:hypothetical protein
MKNLETNKIKKALIIFLVPFIIADIFIAYQHIYFPWDKIPGFYSLFGLITCVLIIFIAKRLAMIGLKKKEDYYD